MSIRWLGRSLGIVIHCNGTDENGCPKDARTQTANVVAKHNRAYAAKSGWGRGLRNAYKRRDLCPDCMPIERKLFEEQQAAKEERKKKRDEERKAKWAAKAQAKAEAAAKPKKRRKRKPSSAVTSGAVTAAEEASIGQLPSPSAA